MKILYFTNVFPHYRISIWKELLNSKKFSISIFYSKSQLDQIEGVDLSRNFSEKNILKLNYIKNYKIFGHIVWQSMSIKKSFFSNYDVILLLGDMKIISNWIVSIISRLRNKKVIFWTHGIYGNESYLKKKIRLLFLSLSNKILLYENNAKRQLIKNGLNPSNLHVIYNSLNYDYQKKLFDYLNEKNNYHKNNRRKIIFIGRLTKVKKIDMLINVINKLNESNLIYDLKIIGDGPEKTYLQSISSKGVEKGYINFLGSLYDEKKIAKLLYNSDLCVSPGNVGLTCIHSLSYGTPVCTHNNFFNQMPESEIITDGKNGIFFEENSLEDLKEKIIFWFDNLHGKYSKEFIRKKIDESYNPANQIKIFNNIIEEWQK